VGRVATMTAPARLGGRLLEIDEFDVVFLEHTIECPTCVDMANAAVVFARVTGSTGATHAVQSLDRLTDKHGARVVRARCNALDSCTCPFHTARRNAPIRGFFHIDVALKAGTDEGMLADRLNDFLSDDRDDVFPEIESVDNVEWLDQ
jgi:hypothetical protein